MAQTNDKMYNVNADGAAEEITPANDTPETANEQDADELVHGQKNDLPTEEKEIDVDDVVHQKDIPAANTDLDLQDPDDLVHGNN